MLKTGISPRSRVLSIGCGIGDTEILLAPHAREVVGIDLSPTAVTVANRDAALKGVANFRAWETTLDEFDDGRFDVIIGIFFLHHLTDSMLLACANRVHALLRPGGIFYSLDPSRYRLSGWVGQWLFPSLMAQYQTDDERQLAPALAASFFAPPKFDTRMSYYDFVSTPLAGILPAWRRTYLATRAADEILTRTPGLRHLSSNFELTAIRT